MSNSKIIIAPSILSADFRCLEEEIKRAEKAGADYIHCDIMDGHFVPNITFGPLVVGAARKTTSLPLDVHLMISNPEKYIQNFRKAGADIITIHAEACSDLPAALQQVRDSGAKVGVCVNPDKPIDLFLPYLGRVDMVLIMTVYAGFGGQKFMSDMLPKIEKVREEIDKQSLNVDIEVDGGINEKTVQEVIRAGANVIVAGSYIFGSDDYRRRIESLRLG